MNFEDPADKKQQSAVTFGYIDYNEVEGGEDGFRYYPNIGLNHWAVLLDDMQYDRNGLGMSMGGKMAIIDSGNSSIQIPQSQFNELEIKMRGQDSTIEKQTVNGRDILVSKQACEDLYDLYGDLQFLLTKTQITIKPKGYLYKLPRQSDCFIGVQSIDDKYNQYRLGTIFLRNFYTGLDFDQNQIMIGLNKDITTATMSGEARNPFRPGDGGFGAVIFVILFLMLMFAIALVCFLRAKKNENNRLVTFAPTTEGDLKKRYKDGVEVKPSEQVKVSLNDSTAVDPDQLDQEETLLDKEH